MNKWMSKWFMIYGSFGCAKKEYYRIYFHGPHYPFHQKWEACDQSATKIYFTELSRWAMHFVIKKTLYYFLTMDLRERESNRSESTYTILVIRYFSFFPLLYQNFTFCTTQRRRIQYRATPPNEVVDKGQRRRKCTVKLHELPLEPFTYMFMARNDQSINQSNLYSAWLM